MKSLSTITLLLAACTALGKEGHIDSGKPKLIMTTEINRQLGGGSKSTKRDNKAGKHKLFHPKQASTSTRRSTRVSKASKDSRDAEVEEVPRQSSKSAKSSSTESEVSRQSSKSAKSSSIESSKSITGTGSTKTIRSSRGKSSEGVNVIETPPDSLPTATSTIIDADVESVSQFLADVNKDGDYKGLQKQNVIVSASGSKSAKSSSTESEVTRQYSKSAKSSTTESEVSRHSSKSAKSSSNKSSKSITGTGSTKTIRSSRGKSSEGVNNVIAPRTNTEADVESVTQFLADVDKDGDKGLQKQNVIVGASALFALIAILAGLVALNRRKTKDADKNIIDSVEITPVEPRLRRDRPPSTNPNSSPPVADDTDYSCDFFGLTSFLACD